MALPHPYLSNQQKGLSNQRLIMYSLMRRFSSPLPRRLIQTALIYDFLGKYGTCVHAVVIYLIYIHIGCYVIYCICLSCATFHVSVTIPALVLSFCLSTHPVKPLQPL